MNKRVKEYASGDTQFAEWLNEIDSLVTSRLGISLFDLGDMLFWDSYDSGETPEEFIEDSLVPEVQAEYGKDIANLLLD